MYSGTMNVRPALNLDKDCITLQELLEGSKPGQAGRAYYYQQLDPYNRLQFIVTPMWVRRPGLIYCHLAAARVVKNCMPVTSIDIRHLVGLELPADAMVTPIPKRSIPC